MYRTSVEFVKNSENLHAVRKELLQIERAHKRAIRDGDDPATNALARLHGLVIGIYAENMLRKIISDPNGFNDRERTVLRRTNTQIQKWLDAVDLAVRRHYEIMFHVPIGERSLEQLSYERYREIRRLLNDELQSLIGDRNKTAHGQWVWHFSDRSETSFKRDPAPKPQNYWQLLQKSKMISTIGSIVYLLVVSEPTFDREYAALTKQLEEARHAIREIPYDLYVHKLRASRVDLNGRI